MTDALASSRNSGILRLSAKSHIKEVGASAQDSTRRIVKAILFETSAHSFLFIAFIVPAKGETLAGTRSEGTRLRDVIRASNIKPFGAAHCVTLKARRLEKSVAFLPSHQLRRSKRKKVSGFLKIFLIFENFYFTVSKIGKL